MLPDEASTEKFYSLLDATLAQFEVCGETYAFAQYFRKQYYFRKEQWGTCYRRGAGINTNMYVEAFHCLLIFI